MMRALVKFAEKPDCLEIREVPIPEIGPDDILLATRAVGVCGWDIEMWLHTMANPVTVPVVQGHEFSGFIARRGANVRNFQIGERVVSETAAVVCGVCPQCRTGNYHLCGSRKGFGYGVDGAFTDYVKVPRRCLHRIPDKVSFDHACLTEPGCVAYQALVAVSRIKPGAPLVVIGPGPMGLMCVQVARASGASPIIVVGTDKEARFKAARALGADLTLSVKTDNVVQIIMDLTNGQGVPLVAETAGNEHSLKLAVDIVARQGQITKIGWGPRPVNFSLDPLLSKCARLQGTFSHNWPTWEAVIAMIGQGTIQMEPMISHRITLDQWRPTFEDIHAGRGVKAVMLFNQD